eukprot:CAMPEP_0182426854 /NCGR_PEP_ID=MMETSP1167-20130531/13371_1 /TAXON_ID=2988 /ORGANISM="Mallomonas Sp, Strain CCMP3275" /LENGTH=517 /DNA_ID=CAMNT_0024608581 /DNA_START=51 /DNA_END=1601 /DNA_ORIENTATION=+
MGIARNVIFHETLLRGEQYSRPLERSNLHDFTEYKLKGHCLVEQVHLSIGNNKHSMTVSYVTTALGFFNTLVYYSTNRNRLSEEGHEVQEDIKIVGGVSHAYSSLVSVNYNLINPEMGEAQAVPSEILNLENTSSWAYDPITKERYANWVYQTEIQYGSMAYNNPKAIYDSPQIHIAVLTDLIPGTRYYYRPKGACDIFSFIAPFEYDSSAKESMTSIPSPYPFTIGLLSDLGQTKVSQLSIAAIAALSPDVTLLAGDLSYADGWPSLWDSFGRMMQSVFAYTPLLTTGGNHEMGSSEGWQHYEARYPTPHLNSLSAAVAYWGRDLGPVHIIALNSYAKTNDNSRQYHWLSHYLAHEIDRNLTPWLVVIMHVPWYSTNSGHWKEGELMRLDMEVLLYSAGVDVVISGHNHAYERTHPIYDGEVNSCGPVYLTVGDGGNYENVLLPWRQPPSDWSAFREASFGVAGLEILNSTHSALSWHRHACSSNSPEALHMNFSDSCISPGDNSEQRMETSDRSW